MYVLIGDPDQGRFEHIRKIIQGAYLIDVMQARDFEEFLGKCMSMARELKLILLTRNLPCSQTDSTMLRTAYLQQLTRFTQGCQCRAPIGYICDENENISIEEKQFEFPAGTLLPPFPTLACKEEFVKILGAYLREYPLPAITLDDDYLLKAQVSFLAEYTDLAEGTRVLKQLAGRFLSDNLKIYRLRSGLSGAHVFRAQVGKKNFLLKLSREQWKLKAEAERHPIVIAGIPGFRQYKTDLQPPKPQIESDGMVARCGRWYAICFTFLGEEEFGPIIDLQEALVGIPSTKDRSNPAQDEANPKSAGVPNLDGYREEQLKFVLDWLKNEWCMKDKRVRRNLMRPWDPAHAPENHYPAMPPYALTLRTKSWIMEFLESEQQIGKRLLKDNWDELELLRSFITRRESYGTAKLDQEILLTVSPSHGDLNANNVLLMVGEVRDPVFLIDFPRYQEQGHALQDFARMETEIKYALMDRQLDTPANELAGFDLTPTQFQIWLELENHLQGNSWREAMKTVGKGFPNNVNLSLTLVQSVRIAAEQVQRQGLAGPTRVSFDDEYLLPLLYYTLNSITYTSLSPYKRLLAAHSAAKLLQRTGFTEQKQQAAASTKTV